MALTDGLLRLVGGRNPIRTPEAVRGAVGGLFGIVACGLLARLVVDHQVSSLPLLVAPIGASAVLVFAVPASPLAQPRSVIGGNVLAALVGVSCALLIPNPVLAAGAAVGFAIAAMALLGCLHPPGGAVALGVVLAATLGEPMGYDYALVPVGLCSVLLVTAGVFYARLTGRTYPHRVIAAPSPHDTQDKPAAARVGYTPADLDRALAQYGDLLDVSREDLDALFRQVELQAHRRIHSQIRCADIMSHDIIAVDGRQTAESALIYLQQHDLRAAPVLDSRGRVIGMVRRAELVAGRKKRVEALLDPFVHKVMPETAIEALLPILSTGAAHEAMVVNEDRVLVGIITQTDLLAVLYRAHIIESVAVGSLDAPR